MNFRDLKNFVKVAEQLGVQDDANFYVGVEDLGDKMLKELIVGMTVSNDKKTFTALTVELALVANDKAGEVSAVDENGDVREIRGKA